MSSNIYLRTTKWLGGVAAIFFAFGIILGLLTPTLFPAATSVLIYAIPFFAIFVGILLLFILMIALIAIRFNGRIPGRTYRNVEYTIIGGILFGVVCLFQPWSLIPYQYGFQILLGSTLAFIVWSHIAPPRLDYDDEVTPLTTPQHLVGIVAGLIVLVALTTSFASIKAPQEPYGLRQRVWDSYTEERKAEVALAATSSFNNVEFPFLILFTAFPAFAVYLVARELVPGGRRRETSLPTNQAVSAAGGD